MYNRYYYKGKKRCREKNAFKKNASTV